MEKKQDQELIIPPPYKDRPWQTDVGHDDKWFDRNITQFKDAAGRDTVILTNRQTGSSCDGAQSIYVDSVIGPATNPNNKFGIYGTRLHSQSLKRER